MELLIIIYLIQASQCVCYEIKEVQSIYETSVPSSCKYYIALHFIKRVIQEPIQPSSASPAEKITKTTVSTASY